MTSPKTKKKPVITAELVDHQGPHPVMEMVPVAPSPADNVLAIISNAVDGGADVATMERLYALYERNIEREQKSAYAIDFVRMKPHLPLVIKRKKNTQTDSNYAPLEDVNQAVDSVLAEYGFGTGTKIIKQEEHGVWVRAELWHRSGHIEHTEVYMPWDDKGIKGTVNKTLPHAISSSIMYARRNAVCALLNISTGDDRDGNKGRGKQKEAGDPFSAEEPTIEQQLAIQADKLADALKKRPDKEKRGALLMKNKPLMNDLDTAGMKDRIAELHKLAEEGAGDETKQNN